MTLDDWAYSARERCEHLGEGTCCKCIAATIGEAVAAEKARSVAAVQSLLDDDDFCGSDVEALQAALDRIQGDDA